MSVYLIVNVRGKSLLKEKHVSEKVVLVIHIQMMSSSYKTKNYEEELFSGSKMFKIKHENKCTQMEGMTTIFV